MSEKVFAEVSKVFAQKDKNNYKCESCDYTCCKRDSYIKHLSTAKHKNMVNCEKVFAKVSEKYVCESCHYTCYIKSNYTKHLNTVKHKNKIILKPEISDNTTVTDPSSNELKLLTGLVVELVKSNNELQKQVLEICKNNNSNNINNNVINSHNKTFNLHLFLNEECKDAMNLSEFINSIQPKIAELENIGKVGYIEGVSDIIINQLNKTQINKRPVHCSDAKREILYVKEENKWEKDTDETKKMVKAVRDVNKKNYQLLANWRDIYPDCIDSNSKKSEEFTNIVGEVVMDNDETNVKKVIKKIAKQVIIDK